MTPQCFTPALQGRMNPNIALRLEHRYLTAWDESLLDCQLKNSSLVKVLSLNLCWPFHLSTFLPLANSVSSRELSELGSRSLTSQRHCLIRGFILQTPHVASDVTKLYFLFPPLPQTNTAYNDSIILPHASPAALPPSLSPLRGWEK